MFVVKVREINGKDYVEAAAFEFVGDEFRALQRIALQAKVLAASLEPTDRPSLALQGLINAVHEWEEGSW